MKTVLDDLLNQPVDIGETGEKIVASWLHQNGYSVIQNTKLPGATDIEAVSGDSKYLVQVKTSVSPNQPSYMTSDEIARIKSRATRIDYVATRARLMIDSQGNLLGQIEWLKL